MGFFSDDIRGTGQPDTIVAGRCSATIRGYGGDDLLIGGPCRDIIKGGSGNDTIYGRGGNDRLIGGSGNDRIVGGKADKNSCGQGDFIVPGRGEDFVKIGGKGSLLPVISGLADGDADTVVYKLNKRKDSLLQFAGDYSDLLDASDRIIVKDVRTDQLDVRLGDRSSFESPPAGVFFRDRMIISFGVTDPGIPLAQLRQQIVGSLG